MIQRCWQVLLVVLFYIGGSSVYSQNYEVDTTSIRSVVTQWNEAHNQIDEDSFDELYAPTVLFYTNDLAKKVCIEKKLSLLNKRPSNQRIVSDLHLTFYEEGIIYCGFTKEVSTGKDKKSYPSYLLLKRFEDQYLITGESDLITDRDLKFRLSLGPQIHISELSSVSLPKRPSPYWKVVLPLLLLVAGVAIYFVRRRSARTSGSSKFSPEAESLNVTYKDNVNMERPSTEQINRTNEKLPVEREEPRDIELEKGHDFEQFVVYRFRLKSAVFKWMDATSDKGVQGHYPASNQNPDLQYEFRLDGKSYPFSVECKFRSMTSGSILLTKDGQIERYKKFKIEKGMDVFIVLGLGGTPKKPAELFVIPISDVKQRMDRETLQPYEAHPTFYYNVEERRLY